MNFPEFKSKKIILDTETSGVHVHLGHRICGIAIGELEDNNSNYYFGVRNHEQEIKSSEIFAWLRELCNNPENTFIFHNAKFDLGMLRAESIEVTGKIVDTMITSHIVQGNLYSYALDALVSKYVPEFKSQYWGELEEYLAKTQPWVDKKERTYNYSLVPYELLSKYALEDIKATRELLFALRAEFERLKEIEPCDNYGCQTRDLYDLFKNEMELIKVLFNMEDRGVLVNQSRTLELQEKTDGEIENYYEEMKDLANFSFAPAAWTQTVKAFNNCGGEIKYWMKPKEKRGKQKAAQFTDKKEESTGRPCFNSVAILRYLEEYPRDTKPWQFMKAYHEVLSRERVSAMFLEPYLRFSDFQSLIHTSFNQFTVLTGRLSSSKPNLQQCAKVKGTIDQKAYEKFLGEKDEEALNRQIRGLFISRPGKVLVAADIGQAEYKTATWLSQDEDMIAKWIADPTIDYHADTMEMLGIDRDSAKITNFGILYGMSYKGLAAALSAMGRPTDNNGAKQILNRVFTARPALRRLLNDTSAQSSRAGFIQNPYGRIVDVPAAKSYKGLNYKVQGFIGDLMRDALVRLAIWIEVNNYPIDMILTVHDEIVSEIPEERAIELAPLFAAEMCKCEFMKIPLLSDIDVGYNWKDMVSLEEWAKIHERKVA